MTAGKIIHQAITILAPPSRVWEALTNPELIKLWLSETEVQVISDWKVGSPIIFSGTWYKKKYRDKGTILKFEKEKAFQYNYLSAFSRLPDKPENYSVIEFRLTPDGNKTMLSVTCSNFATDAIYKHFNLYWPATLNVLKKLIEK